MTQPSELIDDLTTLPAIVGNLGLSIAAAQKAFNLDYLQSVERILAMARSTLGAGTPGAGSEFRDVVKGLIESIAPARYQYTETELEFRADLAQTLSASGAGGLGVNLGAVAVNAAASVGYGYDYRAAARVRTVIHAVPASNSVLTTLLERAGKLSSEDVDLPKRAEVDEHIYSAMRGIAGTLIGAKPRKVGGPRI